MLNNIDQVVEHLQQGGVALVETDTDYALACLPWDEEICSKIYSIKKRPPEKPLTLFISNIDTVLKYIDFNNSQDEIKFKELSQKYWPGPLNFILNKSDLAPKHKYFDKDSLSVVFNVKKSLNQLIDRLGSPLALTSANISGITIDGLVSKEQALENFGDQVILLEYDEDESKYTTMSSTIVKIENGDIKIIRQGDLIV